MPSNGGRAALLSSTWQEHQSGHRLEHKIWIYPLLPLPCIPHVLIQKGFRHPQRLGTHRSHAGFTLLVGFPKKMVATKKSYKYIKYNVIICHQPGSTNLPPAPLQPPP